MTVGHDSLVKGEKINGLDCDDVMGKVLVSPEMGWKGYTMREFILGKDCYTPEHEHDWPHINYVISGEGTLMIDGEINKIKKGSYAYVPNNAHHQFKNTSSEKLIFLCIVPSENHRFNK